MKHNRKHLNNIERLNGLGIQTGSFLGMKVLLLRFFNFIFSLIIQHMDIALMLMILNFRKSMLLCICVEDIKYESSIGYFPNYSNIFEEPLMSE